MVGRRELVKHARAGAAIAPARVIYVAYTLPGDLPVCRQTGRQTVAVCAYRDGGDRLVGTTWIGAPSQRAARLARRCAKFWNARGGPFDDAR